jgi:hypothetical protein
MSHNTAEVTMLYVVGDGQEFACPVCGARYVLYAEDPNLTPIVVMLDGHICAHLDREVLPTSSGAWEVYFAEPGRD